ncbi:MAG: glycosyltransferase family 2 protein [Clostridiales bacterium]|nr:glycosyltransferase family 2 protein [Clostridiales bacterium]
MQEFQEKDKDLVSVIIPTYNRAKVVSDCVRSVLHSSYSNIEVLVVDNCSSDNTVELVNEQFHNANVNVIPLTKNLMAAGGRNAGIKSASGEFLLFLDNDNIIYPDMIELLVNELKKDKSIGLVGPISINVNQGSTMWMASGDYNFFTSRPKTLFAGKKVDEQPLEPRYKTCYSPNAMMVRREALECVGGFDPLYYAMYEEADFGYRILKSGYKAYIVTGARTNHLYYVNEGEQSKLRVAGIGFPERAYHFAKNRSIFMKKYAKWYHLFFYYLFFVHAFAFYYCIMALRYNRKDIAKAYFIGTYKGLIMKASRSVKVEI